MIENMAKHMIMMRDQVLQECMQFLEHCEGMESLLFINYHLSLTYTDSAI